MNRESITRKELESAPKRDWNQDIGKFRSLVILPKRTMHDSGYRCMDFVAIDDKGNPIARLAGYSDVLHIGGISAFTGKQPEVPWSIDCLPKCGLLQLFASGYDLSVGDAFSSFEVFAHKREKNS